MSISLVSECLTHPPTWWADIHPVALHQIKDTGQEASVAFIPLAHKQPLSVCLRRIQRVCCCCLGGPHRRLWWSCHSWQSWYSRLCCVLVSQEFHRGLSFRRDHRLHGTRRHSGRSQSRHLDCWVQPARTRYRIVYSPPFHRNSPYFPFCHGLENGRRSPMDRLDCRQKDSCRFDRVR